MEQGVKNLIKKKENAMYCTRCGQENNDNAFRCVQCGNILQHPPQSGPEVVPVRRVPTYLAQAILVTLFCCLPFGIYSIVLAAQVDGRVSAGDYAGALEKSQQARKWCWISFGTGLGILVLWFFIGLLGALADL